MMQSTFQTFEETARERKAARAWLKNNTRLSASKRAAVYEAWRMESNYRDVTISEYFHSLTAREIAEL